MTDALYAYLASSEMSDDVTSDIPDRGRHQDQYVGGREDPIIAQVRSGNDQEARRAFDLMFRQTYAKLVRFAVHYVGTSDAAEDVVDEVFASVWANRGTVSTHGSFEGYLFGAVRRRAISMHRQMLRQGRDTPPILGDGEHWGMGVPAEAPDVDVVRADVHMRIWRAIAELPERQREILTLRWQGELGWEDIARVLESTSAAVQMQHSRAAKILRERLAAYLK